MNAFDQYEMIEQAGGSELLASLSTIEGDTLIVGIASYQTINNGHELEIARKLGLKKVHYAGGTSNEKKAGSTAIVLL